ncbi:MAG TPA: hypothetical protein VG839_05900 [Asticcacaulis sp.]|nr:hypothetical protein [Asticcacaulis sp.]
MKETGRLNAFFIYVCTVISFLGAASSLLSQWFTFFTDAAPKGNGLYFLSLLVYGLLYYPLLPVSIYTYVNLVRRFSNIASATIYSLVRAGLYYAYYLGFQSSLGQLDYTMSCLLFVYILPIECILLLRNRGSKLAPAQA